MDPHACCLCVLTSLVLESHQLRGARLKHIQIALQWLTCLRRLRPQMFRGCNFERVLTDLSCVRKSEALVNLTVLQSTLVMKTLRWSSAI